MSEPRDHEEVAHAAHGELHDDEEAAVGPVDVDAWRALLIGLAVAGLVVLFLYLAAYGG